MPKLSITMEVDANGVVVAACTGTFDAEQWIRLRCAVFESRYALEDYDGRPVVTDLRDCALPERDWAQQFRTVAENLKHQRRKPFRRALIIGEEAGADLAVTLFAEYQKIFHHPDVETRAFHSYADGYAWAHAALAPAERQAPTG